MGQILDSELQDIAVQAGSIVLENGGETYRSEETVVKIASSLGAKQVSSFVTPTVVILSYSDENGDKHTFMNRIFKRGTDLRKVARINDLSRRLAKRGKATNTRQIKFLLQYIEDSPVYPVWSMILMGGLTSLCFTRMFGGSFLDGVMAFIAGVILKAVLILLERIRLNSFIVSLVSGALISVIVDLAGLTSLSVDTSIVMTGTLMQVVPGLALVNSIRDLISGDLISGTARLMEAVMIALGLSVGAVSGLLLQEIV